MVELGLACAFAYLLGSIPFGLVLTRLAGLGDIRSIGSGNIGATNVLRTGNKKLAALTLFLDMIKGVVAVVAVRHFVPDAANAAAVAALLGHTYPVWLRFKGGKGVATGCGVMLALCWPAALILGGIWLAMARLSKISSLSALVAVGLSPVVLFLMGRADLVLTAVAIGALIFWKHQENIRRLINRTEPKIGEKKNAPAKPAE